MQKKKNPMGRKKETESTCEGKDQRKTGLTNVRTRERR